MSNQVLVEALKTYKEKGIQDKVLGRIPEEGEQWYISNERLNTLLGENEYHLAFVRVVESESTEEQELTGKENVNDEPIIIENESLTTKTQKKYSKRK